MNRLLYPIAWLSLALLAADVGAAAGADPTAAAAVQTPSYAYATNGVMDDIQGGMGSKWKLLLNASNLGGQELEAAEVTLQPGTTVPSHLHGAVEVIYVLSGTYGHEVNGKLFLLKPGMVGIVRPGDKVRHLVPKEGPAKLLIIWAPAGEAERVLRQAKGVTPPPVPQATVSAEK
jgi:quercetin dioxygenase-like cupin family protein